VEEVNRVQYVCGGPGHRGPFHTHRFGWVSSLCTARKWLRFWAHHFQWKTEEGAFGTFSILIATPFFAWQFCHLTPMVNKRCFESGYRFMWGIAPVDEYGMRWKHEISNMREFVVPYRDEKKWLKTLAEAQP